MRIRLHPLPPARGDIRDIAYTFPYFCDGIAIIAEFYEFQDKQYDSFHVRVPIPYQRHLSIVPYRVLLLVTDDGGISIEIDGYKRMS